MEGESKARTEISVSGGYWAVSGVRAQSVTACPPWASHAAAIPPIAPGPMTAIVLIAGFGTKSCVSCRSRSGSFVVKLKAATGPANYQEETSDA